MIFLPKGLKNGEVIDPDKTAQDYIEANRIAAETTHYQWRENEFDTGIDKFDESICKVHYESTVAKLKVTVGNVPVLPTTPATIPISSGGTALVVSGDANLFLVPLNKGFHDITGSSITWNSKYPELVHITFSFQYVRDRIDNYNYIAADAEGEPGDAKFSKHNKIRLQTAIDIDGALVTGSGPGGLNLEESPRGLGYAARSLATTVNIIQFLPAGVHTAKAVAAILPVSQVRNDGLNENVRRFLPPDSNYGLVPSGATAGKSWHQNICIGTRNLIVVRYGRGKMLRS
tara:strand:+ start:2574 stop:3437 length:864 start_codon:yes stop_codon:yes gene_type:complete